MRTQTHRNARTLTTVRFTTVWTVTHTVFLSPIKDTHTQLHVWLSTTPTESARLSRLRARGGRVQTLQYVRTVGVRVTQNPHPSSSMPLNAEGQCETRERLLRLTRSHATGGTRINDRQTVAGPTTQATATRSTTHNKNHARTGREGVP